MTEVCEIAVLGGGIVGATTAECLARRGHRVVLLDRFPAGHEHGSSHGDGRIIRYTYAEASYVEMARFAYGGWAALEEAAGVDLVARTGSWECGPEDSVELAAIEASFQHSDIPYERFDAAESKRRIPLLQLPTGSIALYQADGGIVRAGAAVAAAWRLARAAGAELVDGARIIAIDPGANHVRLRAADGRAWEAGSVVLAAGGWCGGLLRSLDLDLSLTVSQEQVAYFPATGDIDHGIGHLPTVIDYHAAAQPFYALPHIEIEGVKVGWHRSGREVEPDHPLPQDGAQLAALQRWVAERFPHLTNQPSTVVSCLYTNTPDYHFVLDRHPAFPRLVIGAGLSGHGFKFAPAIAAVLAALACDETPPINTDLFRIERLQHPERLVQRTTA